MKIFFRHSAIILILCVFIAQPVQARSILDSSGSFGRPIFRLDVFDQGDVLPGKPPSGFTLNAAQRQSIVAGVNYWSEMLSPFATPKKPGLISLLTNDTPDINAFAFSELMPGTGGLTELSASLYGKGPQSGHFASITIFRGPGDDTWYAGPMLSLPQNGAQLALGSTIVHEMTHALGMSASVLRDTSHKLVGFGPESTLWTTHLRDKWGTAATPGQSILYDNNAPKGTDFIINTDENYSGVTFVGPEVMALLTVEGQVAQIAWPDTSTIPAVEGLPVLGSDLSHLELQNGNLSHQKFRNWSVLMEAELAALQDSGLKFDRRNLYGFSVYNSNITFVNTNPYYARTPDGKWIVGQPNATAYGIGFHVYGSNNTLRQAADLLSSGTHGIGIRIDGVKNSLTIDPGTRVQADGYGGTGLMVAYGKDHTIVQRGVLTGKGAGGIGARFDFGDSIMGQIGELRGSYIQRVWDTEFNIWVNLPLDTMPEALQGALVKSFDVTGLVAGDKASIFISQNALVNKINVMQGAYLQGDIVSEWDIHDNRIQYETDETDETGEPGDRKDLITMLSFGLKADATGKATAVADGDFFLRYDGNISGLKGLSLSVEGGTLSYNGKAELIEAGVKAGATLKGSAEYVLNSDSRYGTGTFINAGTLAPGNSIGKITINGNFTNTGTLAMEFNASETDSLIVTGGTTNIANGSKLTLTPLPDFYASNVTRVITNSELFGGAAGSATQGDFSSSSITPIDSPTLSTSSGTVGGQNTFTVTRAANAYSQFGSDANSRAAGSALNGIVNVAQGDMQKLITALDFSAADGSTVRSGLKQLSPAPYGYAAQASAENNLTIGRMALSQLRVLRPSGAPNAHGLSRGSSGYDVHGLSGGSSGHDAGSISGGSSGSSAENRAWTAFVTPFASTATQQQSGNMQGYNSMQAGLMGGFTRQQDAWNFGLYTAFAHRQTNVWTTGGAESEGASLHVGGMAAWQPKSTDWGGWRVFAAAQVGMENADATRSVDINGYARENRSFQTAFSGTAMLGGGWQWTLDSLSFGPYVGLEYALNFVPGFQEESGQGSRLSVDSFTRHDLRAVGGVTMAWTTPLGDESQGRQLKATLDAAWRQDVLNPEYTMRSAFVGYSGYGFDTTVQRQGNGSLGLQGSLQMDLRKDVTLAAHVQADVLRPGYNALGGGLSLRWEF